MKEEIEEIEIFENSYIKIKFIINKNTFTLGMQILEQTQLFINSDIIYPTSLEYCYCAKNGICIRSLFLPMLGCFDIWLRGSNRWSNDYKIAELQFISYDELKIKLNEYKEALNDWAINAPQLKRFTVVCKELK
jgi:hypothetical protein